MPVIYLKTLYYSGKKISLNPSADKGIFASNKNLKEEGLNTNLALVDCPHPDNAKAYQTLYKKYQKSGQFIKEKLT